MKKRLKNRNRMLKALGGCSTRFSIGVKANKSCLLYLNWVTKSFLIRMKSLNIFVNISQIQDLTQPKNCKHLQNHISIFLQTIFPTSSLFLREISEQEVIDICCSLSPGKAIGYYGITFNIIKETITSISRPLTHISIFL